MEENGNINNQEYDILHSTRYSIYKFSMRVSMMSCFLITIILVFSTCTRQGKSDESLDRAESLMNTAPDSALTILNSLEPSSHDFSKENLRRWQLLRLTAQNKCDTVFHSDSLQLELVKYYDRHGSPNERMTAHYLLGRAYYDMGEAPRALESFLDAVACADTTSLECDYKSLFRIYGQIAMIYQMQYIPSEELVAWERYSHFALKSGDIYNHIRGKEMTLLSYYGIGDTVACLRITEQCRKEYLENGMTEAAASVFPTAIYIYLLKSDYDQAKKMMDTFEGESGLFDSCGNISKGREGYYYSKGLYYLGILQNDSAELFFRKLQNVHIYHDFRANKGLLSLYRNEGNNDSISKYALLFEKSCDAIINENQADAVAQAAAYNKYSRLQKESKAMAIKAEKSKWLSRLSLIVFLVIFAVTSYLFILYKRKQKEKIESLGVAYTNLMLNYRQACYEADSLKFDKGQAQREKEEEIAQLKSKLDEMENLFESLTPNMKIQALSKSEIVKKFKTMTIPRIPPSLPTHKDWKLLMETIEYTNPSLYGRIVLSNNFSPQEIYTCLLTLLHFSTDEVAVLINTSKQRVSNTKASANYKLFGNKDAKALLRNLESL